MNSKSNSVKKLLLIMALSFKSEAQTVTLTATTPASGLTAYSANSVTLGVGDTASIITGITNNGSSAAAVTIGNTEFNPPVLYYGSPGTSGGSSAPVPAPPFTVAGPATIRARVEGYGQSTVGRSSLITVVVVRANSTPSSAPLNTVVVPENAAGPVSVLLESSTDLLTWTAANPGTYGSATSKRFFRVRAVTQ
jgi:hypothetical protein